MRQFFASHFTKREYHIPMRDGVTLYTAVYTPEAAQFPDKGPYPFLMTRTPYSCAPYGADKIAPRVTGNQKLLEGWLHPGVPGCARAVGQRGNVAGDDAVKRWKGR